MQGMTGNPHTAPRGFSRRRLLTRSALLLGGLAAHRFAAAGHLVRPWPHARPVPALDLKRWRLDALAGKVVVLNFWATWCEPCRLEMPSLAAMAMRRQGEGVVVAAVNYLEAPDVIRRFLERAPFKPPILLDSDGDATVAWTPRVFPSTVVIGRDGQPVHVVGGELDWESAEARALLDPLVAAPRRG